MELTLATAVINALLPLVELAVKLIEQNRHATAEEKAAQLDGIKVKLDAARSAVAALALKVDSGSANAKQADLDLK